MKPLAKKALPPKVRKSLKKLGEDLRTARLRRNILVAQLAERAGVAPGTILRLENGDPGVGMGTLVLAMWLLGLNDRMMQLVDDTQDGMGLALETEQRRKRARRVVFKAEPSGARHEK